MDKKTASLLQGYQAALLTEGLTATHAIAEAKEFLTAAEQYLRQFLTA